MDCKFTEEQEAHYLVIFGAYRALGQNRGLVDAGQSINVTGFIFVSTGGWARCLLILLQ